MKTMDVTLHLQEGKLAVPGLDLEKMPLPNVGDFVNSRTIRPDGVCILRVPREAITATGLALPESARESRNVGWVLTVGPKVENVKPRDIVSFLPINFQIDDEATKAVVKFGGNRKTRDTEIGWAIESELERIVPPME